MTLQSILFFQKKINSLVKSWDWRKGGSDTLIRFCPPFMYCVFHHFSDHLHRQILFLPLLQKRIRSDLPPGPPPMLGKKKFSKGKVSGGFPLACVIVLTHVSMLC